ncbi:hypothetical protein LOTGIDRAFT_231773 [Lottia gigantea]|uniref:KY-like immunoglobulin-like domain-containing protein n=1 Tax=Lottia gigantea TaxID=225164 RepID=V4AJ05_LOTGI|nr:hypothetical protein LOTGIDRAFT_231773 [Lottia gigantea]ESO97032.1 hypothetical protein LOTGIDRAFT_231773 [Lottia gigantea]
MAGLQIPFKVTEGYLGPQSKFEAYGLEMLAHPDPIIDMAGPTTEIIMKTLPGTRVTTKMLSTALKKECNEYHLIRRQGDNFLFLLAPPHPGFYKFQIYALPKGEAGPSMQGVFNYIVHCPNPENDIPFPKQYPQFKDGGYLTEPLKIPKGNRDPEVKFNVSVPNSSDVQVKVNNDWNPLEQTSPGTWEGLVDLSKNYPPGAKVKLNCKFGGHNYNTLLEYTI